MVDLQELKECVFMISGSVFAMRLCLFLLTIVDRKKETLLSRVLGVLFVVGAVLMLLGVYHLLPVVVPEIVERSIQPDSTPALTRHYWVQIV